MEIGLVTRGSGGCTSVSREADGPVPFAGLRAEVSLFRDRFFSAATAAILLSRLAPGGPTISLYARFLGLCSTALAVCQYAPQLIATYRLKHVGALSIPTMLIQTPGSIMFVASLIGRPGVEWSSWLAYAATGVMQGGLLAMCLAWKQSQKTLGVDDFGQPIRKDPEEQEQQQES